MDRSSLIVTLAGILTVATWCCNATATYMQEQIALRNDLFGNRKKLSTSGHPNHNHFENYDRHVRPVENLENNLEVTVGLTLLGIQDVDLEDGVMTSQVWLHLSWVNEYLTWDPEKYDNKIEELRIEPAEIWTPDIVVFNDADGDFSERLKNNAPNIFVNHEGYNYWVTPLKLRTLCPTESMNRTHTSCQIRLGSWTYNENRVNLTMEHEEASLEYYTPSTIWTLQGTHAASHVTVYNCCPEGYIDLTYDIDLLFNPKH